ncbi:hypothetical protein VTL71DRAFT_13709 [Oculimacula yallundae]|uniref:Secreted protein n=1 Tax=Oculimacula yallundae TaxID=86028 RepID=A0ABR4CL62_9HELO
MMAYTLFTLALLVLALLSIEVTGTSASSQINSVATFMSPGGVLLPYPSVPLEFNGTIDGTPVVAQGSFQELYAQLGLEDPTETAVGFFNESAAALASREMSDCNCVPVPHNPTWKRAYVFSLDPIIKVMRDWHGDCNMKAHRCMQLNCFRGSAVHACNDRGEDKHIPCNRFADYTQKVRDQCFFKKRGSSGEAGGQLWDTEGWNIYVINQACVFVCSVAERNNAFFFRNGCKQ